MPENKKEQTEVKENTILDQPKIQKAQAEHSKNYKDAKNKKNFSYNIQTSGGDVKTKHVEVVEFKNKTGKTIATKQYLRGIDKNGKPLFKR